MTENMSSVAEYLSKHQLAKIIEDAVNDCYKSQTNDPQAFLVHFSKIYVFQSLNISRKMVHPKPFPKL
jgi:hypothetical protein